MPREEVEQIVSKLPHFYHYPNKPNESKIRDLLDWYNNLTIEDCLTDEEIEKLSPDFGNDKKSKMILSLISKPNNTCNGIRGQLETCFNENWYAELRADDGIYYDIKITGITPDSYNSIVLKRDSFELCDGVWNPQTKTVDFPDFPQNNPLFAIGSLGIYITLKEPKPVLGPDQVTITFNTTLFNYTERQVYLSNLLVSRIPSKQNYLVVGAFGSCLLDYDELTLVYPEGYEKPSWQEEESGEECDDIVQITVCI